VVPAPAPAPPAGPKFEKFSVWVPVKLLAVPLVAFFVTAFVERDASVAEAIGAWFGLMLIPLLVALLSVRFKPGRKMRTFSTVFCCVGLFCFVAVFQRRLTHPEKTPQEIIREAAGTQPVVDTGSPLDRVGREFIAGMIAARKKHDQDAAPLRPVLATLYTADSFKSRQRMEEMISAVRKIQEVDGAMADKIQGLPAETRARLDASGASQQEKDDFMVGFQRAYGNSDVLAAWGDVHFMEEEWGPATVDLYTFASEHASSIKTDSKQILIADKSLLSQFNAKLTSSQDLKHKLHEANVRMATIQSENMEKLGITKSDPGLKK
jgi:hypothetical protein